VPVRGRDEVAALAESFNRAAQRIEDLVRSSRSLLANASHELRSPLARIRMAIELNGEGATSAASRDELRRNIAELDSLIDEILLASRLDATPVADEPARQRFESVDLAGLFAEEAARVGVPLDLIGPATRSGAMRACCAACCETCWRMPCATAAAKTRCRRVLRTTAHGGASRCSTAAPACPPTNASGFSNRSTGHAAPVNARAASGWVCRWCARSRSIMAVAWSAKGAKAGAAASSRGCPTAGRERHIDRRWHRALQPFT
jgi:hypothetical protein